MLGGPHILFYAHALHANVLILPVMWRNVSKSHRAIVGLFSSGGCTKQTLAVMPQQCALLVNYPGAVLASAVHSGSMRRRLFSSVSCSVSSTCLLARGQGPKGGHSVQPSALEDFLCHSKVRPSSPIPSQEKGRSVTTGAEQQLSFRVFCVVIPNQMTCPPFCSSTGEVVGSSISCIRLTELC